ncbi:DUF3006 domain-containing protein [Caldalkalibacillus salinus]|uniref:DUF3006 domain-containing protein n=1 Tax=Caldalkalibacillus salinus TaxID=2803787 RepID=UPI0019250246|nr:DUF3006 domain-containing protein [Caldalkalibacillus salinus]
MNTKNQKKRAVIDRMDAQRATLLVGDEETERTVLVENLPQGAKEGMWLTLEETEEDLLHIQIDEEETVRRKKLMKQKLDKLRQRSKGSKFRRL